VGARIGNKRSILLGFNWQGTTLPHILSRLNWNNAHPNEARIKS
jgi:hypothetical protein